MNLPSRVSMEFKSSSVAKQVNLGNAVVAGLSANEVLFPAPVISVAELKDLNEALEAGQQEVYDTGSKQARAKIKNTRAAWVNAFGLTASYVDFVSTGVESNIVEAGFRPTKAVRHKKGIPPVASGFRAGTNGVKGSVLANIDKVVADAVAFIYYALPDGASVSFDDKTMVVTMGGQQLFINAATKRMTEIYTQKNKASFNVGVFAVNAAGIGPSTPMQEVITQ